MDSETLEKIELLKDYFQNRDDISFVFLFGSRVNKTKRNSDWDIGIYFKPLSGSAEWESPKIYEEENPIYLDLSRILGTDTVDLVVLNCCPSHMADAIVRQGHPILIKDRSLYLDFLLIVGQHAEDFRILMHDYFLIYHRSSSLSQEDRIRLEKRIIFLENELKDFSWYKKFTPSDYQENVYKRREIERWVENIMNAVLDIAKVILSAHKIDMPETYRDTIEKLSGLGLSIGVIQPLAQWIQLRNILAHEYLELRWRRMHDFLDQGQEVFLGFLEFAKKMLV